MIPNTGGLRFIVFELWPRPPIMIIQDGGLNRQISLLDKNVPHKSSLERYFRHNAIYFFEIKVILKFWTKFLRPPQTT